MNSKNQKNLEICANLLKQLQRGVSLVSQLIGELEQRPNILMPLDIRLTTEPVDRELRQIMKVYWIGCRGLHRAAKTLADNTRIDRIGCTTEQELSVRLSTANADAYGAWHRDNTGKLTEDEGFNAWVMQAINTTRVPTNPAITVRTRSIEIQLPPTMTRRMFDSALHRSLERWSLAALYPNATRYTRYHVGVERMSKAREFYTGLDPRHDGDLLVGLIEKILTKHDSSCRETTASSHADKLHPHSPLIPVVRRRRQMTASQVRAMQARLREKYALKVS